MGRPRQTRVRSTTVHLGHVLVPALIFAACGGTGDRPLAGSSPSPAQEGIRFVFEESYEVSETIDVRIENLGPDIYEYNVEYQACDLTYRDASNREFIIPPGTHCDLVVMMPIQPGQTKTLFRWDLDECIEDQWGCLRSEPLPPGDYTIEGSFHPVGGGEPSRVETSFRIVPPA